jgi:hypothetical protein
MLALAQVMILQKGGRSLCKTLQTANRCKIGFARRSGLQKSGGN